MDNMNEAMLEEPDHVEAGIELTEEDERILDQVWAQVGEQLLAKNIESTSVEN